MRMDLEGQFNISGEQGGGESNERSYTPSLTFKLKGRPDGISLDYSATIDPHSTLIVGGYKSEPFDMGHFMLRKW